ncbi:transposase [Rhodococcus opacus]|uniref:transposase n=1 Tax=Rhodococcus opacus TaxID=37919 RepID=UPI001BAF1AD3|nr:transposase [Rhodococcus opacus]
MARKLRNRAAAAEAVGAAQHVAIDARVVVASVDTYLRFAEAVKMEHAVTLAKPLDAERVDWALGHAGAASVRTHRADESRSLAQGTAGWARFGAPIPTELTDTEGTGATEP